MSSNGLHSKSDNHSTLSSSSPPTLSCASSSSTTTSTSTTASTATSTTQNIQLNNGYLKLSHFNNQFKCSLCSGYIINATTINECLHSFCRSCIVKYLNDNHDCPKCGLKLSETRKWETLRMDSILQSFIYKLVPGLFRSEMKLRKEFNAKSSDAHCDSHYDEQKVYYQLNDKISVILMHSKSSNDVKDKKSSFNSKKASKTTSSSSDEHRYLLCPAGFPIVSLKKFICLKYELSSCFKVDIMFDDQILDDDMQLLDVVYIYSTQQPIPLHFKLNNFSLNKNNQTLTTSKSQINVIKKSLNDETLPSPTSSSLTSSSYSSSSSTKTSTSASTATQSSNFHMKTATTTTSNSTNTPNNGNARNDVNNDNRNLKSVAVQSLSVISCGTSPMNPVSSSTLTDPSSRNSSSLSTQNIDHKNQLERNNERGKQPMHSVSSSIKQPDSKRIIKPKVINNKLAPLVNQINLKQSPTSVLPSSTQVTTVTLTKQSKPSSVKTNKPSNLCVKSVELTNREIDKRFMNGYDNIKLTPISCSQSPTPKVTITATNSSSSSSSSPSSLSVSSSTPSVSITATTMVTTTSNGAKSNFISKHLNKINESEKRKESDCRSEAPRKHMKVSQGNDKVNSVTSSNQNDSSKSPSAPTSPKQSSIQTNNINIAASNNDVNKMTRYVNDNCKASHSVGTSIPPNNSQTSVNAPRSVPSSVITNSVSAGSSNPSSCLPQNNKNNKSTNSDVKSNGIKVDHKLVNSSTAIKSPSVSSSSSATVTSKTLSSSSSSPHLVIAPSPSPSTSSSSSPSPKLSISTVTSSKPSTISSSTSPSSSSSCTSTSTSTTKVVSSSFQPSTTSTSTLTSISRLVNNQQQKVKQSGQGDKRHRESPSSSSPANATDNRASKMMKISKNQTSNSQHKNLQMQHQQMIKNQLTNDNVFNVEALIAAEKEAALTKDSPQTGFTLKSMPVDLRNPRNMNKPSGLHALPPSSFQSFHHFANPSSVLVPIATGSSGHSSGAYHEPTFPNMAYLEYSKLLKLTSEAFMQHLHQANSASFGVNLNLNGNVNGNGNVSVNGKPINSIEGERVKGFYKETLCNSPNRENGTKNDKN